MEEFIPIQLVEGDENSSHFTCFHDNNNKHGQNQQQQQYVGVGSFIKLRDLNTEIQRPVSQKTLKLVE